MYSSLQEYIAKLESIGELIRIKTEVNTEYEITEIVDRVSKSKGGGKALLFENTASKFPMLINMFGSDKRIATALGVENLEELTDRIEHLLHSVVSPKNKFTDKLKMLPLLGEVSQWLPKTSTKKGKCQEIILKGEDAKLSSLPILKCWPNDGGKFITLPLVNTIDPNSGTRNVGMYRMQVTGEQTTGMHWHLHKTGERHYREYAKRNELMPISICLGGDPAYIYSATAPMPDNMDEYLLAGFLRRKAVTLVKCVTNDIYVPSDCDFVIEGYVDPKQAKFIEGPFGDHTGFYSLEDLYPEFHVTAITHRKDAIYSATIVGVPPQEDAYIAKATEKIFLAPIRFAIQPEIKDLYMPDAGTAHNIAIVDIETTYAGQPYKVASSLWGAGQMMFNKLLLVAALKNGESLKNSKTIAKLLRNVNIPENIMFSKGVYDVLDHATATHGEGGKLMFDATAVADTAEPTIGHITLTTGITSACRTLVEEWSTLILYADPHTKISYEEFCNENCLDGINFIVFMDSATSILLPNEILWIIAANIEPQRDIKVISKALFIDARSKIGDIAGYPKRFPNVVTSSQEVIDLVDKRWYEYGIGEFIESPSTRYRKLLLSENAEI